MTSQFGYTAPGQQLNALSKMLASITAMPSNANQQDVQNAYASAQSQAIGAQAAEPAFLAQQQQQLSQQAGIPGLQSQYGDLSKAFEMYLHDNNLAGKYASQQNTNPYANAGLMAGSQPPQQAPVDQALFGAPAAGQTPISGQATSAPNPYLASTDALASASQPQGDGFTGFASPGLTTAAMAAPVNATTRFMDLLQSAIGQQQGVVSDALRTPQTDYEQKLGIYNTIAQMLGSELATKNTTQNALTTPGTKQNAGGLFNDIITQLQQEKSGKATEQDIWNYINQHDASLRDQGANVDELWRLHKDLAGKVGWNGLLTGGKTPVKQTATDRQATKDLQKKKTDEETKRAALKGFGSMMNIYYKDAMNLGIGRVISPADTNYFSQRDIYVRQLQKALGASKARQTSDAITKNLPDVWSTNAEGSFKGHLEQVLNANKLQLFKDDKTGNIGIVDYSSFDPVNESQLSTNDLSIDQIQQLLKTI